MKPLHKILSENPDDSLAELTVKMRADLEDADEFGAADLVTTLDEYITDVTKFTISLVLDVAEQVGALPEGRKQAEDEADAAVVYLKTMAVYKAAEAKEEVGE